MKKLIVIVLLFLCYQVNSQPIYTGNVDTNKILLTSLFEINLSTHDTLPIPITKMGQVYDQYYEVAVKCDSVLKVSFGDTTYAAGNWRKVAGSSNWDYLGRFSVKEYSDMCLRKFWGENTAQEFSIQVWGEK